MAPVPDMSRPHNFSAGPAALPLPVLEQAAAEMLDWRGSGMSVMEMSHRGKEFGEIHAHAVAGFRELLQVPSEFEVLFMQGGGLAENAIVPMNLSRGEQVAAVLTGAWSEKSVLEAQKYAAVRIAASAKDGGYLGIPPVGAWQIDPRDAYVHICANETIHGVEFAQWPDLRPLGSEAPLVVDFSSNVLSRPVDWSRVGLAFGGAQKNIGPAGLTIVVVRKALLDRALPICPSAFHFKTVAEHGSMYNTPPTWAIYVAGLVFDWVKNEGGVAEMAARSERKAAALYGLIDRSALYESRVHPSARSKMNVPFFLRNEALNEAFLAGAKARGLLQIKGHKAVGGMRASLYTAVSEAAVEALLAHMREFEAAHG